MSEDGYLEQRCWDCWRALGTKGFKYKDETQTPDGLDSILLRAGAEGKAKVMVKGRGSNLELPALPLTLPVTVQLRAENGECWGATYFLEGAKNTPDQFKAKAGEPQ